MSSRLALLQPLLLGASMAAWAAGDVPPPELACQNALRDYQDGARSPESERLVRQLCFPQQSRAPLAQPPIAVHGTGATAAPVPVAPPVFNMPGAPTVLTRCDAGGCWDSQGIRYNGTGTILHGPGGSVCTRSADRIECR
jgi:hypothetical protein